MLKVVQTDQVGQLQAADVPSGSLLDEIAREGARRMLAAALKAESDAYVDAFTGERDEDGHRLVVRNGHAEPRTVVCAAGAVEVRAPRVNDKRIDEATGEGSGSPRRSCRPGAGAARRSPRCCRCSTCMGCPAAISRRRSRSSSAARRGCPPRR